MASAGGVGTGSAVAHGDRAVAMGAEWMVVPGAASGGGVFRAVYPGADGTWPGGVGCVA